MALYLLQVAYTPEAWAVQLNNPLDRREAVSPVVEQLGGYIESAYYAFGDYDAILIIEMPDNVSAAAFSLAVSAGRAVKAIKTRCRGPPVPATALRADNASKWRAQ